MAKKNYIESEILELKSTLSEKEEILETISAFSNTIKYIVQWGTGTNRIVRLCKEAGLPEPEFNLISGCFVVTFYRNKESKKHTPRLNTEQSTEQVPGKYRASTEQVPGRYPPGTPQVPPKYPSSTPQVLGKYHASNEKLLLLLDFCKVPRSRKDIQERLLLKDRKYFRLDILNPLLAEGLLKMLYPNKPNSPKQKYVITEKGKQILNSLQVSEKQK